MDPVPSPEPDHEVLRRRLKASFAPIYLTALSVIQGVALADLAMVVFGDYGRFTAANWLQAGANLMTFVVIWNAYILQSTIWEWIPDFRDSVIPFAFGALELFLNHAIVISLSSWLLALGLLATVGVIANWFARRRAVEETENKRLSDLLGQTPVRREVTYMAVLVMTMLVLALVTQLTGVDTSRSLNTADGAVALAIVLVSAFGIGVFVVFIVRSWGYVIVYARTGQMPGV